LRPVPPVLTFPVSFTVRCRPMRFRGHFRSRLLQSQSLRTGRVAAGLGMRCIPCGTSARHCQRRFRRMSLAGRPLTHTVDVRCVTPCGERRPVTTSSAFGDFPCGSSPYSPDQVLEGSLRNAAHWLIVAFGRVPLREIHLLARCRSWRVPCETPPMRLTGCFRRIALAGDPLTHPARFWSHPLRDVETRH